MGRPDGFGVTMASIEWADAADDRAQLGRIGTVERVTEVLRTRILHGDLPPGTRLSEEALSHLLGVSRNTLREAFRLLSHERLVEHEFNRGVFVRALPIEDVHDLYTLRRVVECAAVRGLHSSDNPDLEPIIDAVERANAAARADDWRAVATADLEFHRGIAALAGSERIDELMRRVSAELRLAFVVIADPRELHEPFLERNVSLCRMLAAGESVRAELELDRYLRDSEERLAAAYARGAEPSAPKTSASAPSAPGTNR